MQAFGRTGIGKTESDHALHARKVARLGQTPDIRRKRIAQIFQIAEHAVISFGEKV